MTRWIGLAVAAVAGLALGMGTLLALQGGDAAAPVPARDAGAPQGGGADGQPAEAGVKPAPVPEPDERLLLVWTSGGLPEGLGDAIATLSRVEQATVVHGDLVELVAVTSPDGQTVEEHVDGWVVPLDAIAIDVPSYRDLAPKSAHAAFTEVAGGQALLSESAAALRGVGPGSTLRLADGTVVTVAAVVDDEVVGGAELVVGHGRLPAVSTSRYVLLTYAGERAALEQAIRELAPDISVRVRGAGESPFLRHGDAVLPQALVKERFGEFAYRRTGGREVAQDPGFAAERIIEARVPILGTVRCHQAVVDALRDALDELASRNLEHLVDPDGYAGCHEPRLTSSLESVSRHAWGIAVDLNVDKNPVGGPSHQDPRLVEVMERHGFAWGGEWLVPDPAHFEWVRPRG